METRLAIITGSTGAIGQAIVRQVLASGLYTVIMVARDTAKTERTYRELAPKDAPGALIIEMADLSRKEEIVRLAARVQGPVGVLVNNAAYSPRLRQETPEGVERQWATNVLAYYWMIQAFTPHLQAGAPSRVVNVASYWAGGMDLEDPEFKHRRYNNDEAYRQSKQADRMMTVAFAETLSPVGITVNACHPGDVNSRLSNDLGFGGHETPDQGADTPAWLACSPDLEGITGKYFARRRQETCEFSRDRNGIERLMKLLENY